MIGLLKVDGAIELDQFWPAGDSDADTTKIIVKTGANSFGFRPHPAAPFKPTHVFKRATVVGKVRRSPVDNKGRLTVRLQGIDAPELHYKPSPISKKGVPPSQRDQFNKLNRFFRQYFGESAIVALRDLLAKSGKKHIPCTITTAVESPDDVFDTYGRFVGDIEISLNHRKVNINHWLVKEGWAFPAFYNSMSSIEITAILTHAAKGKTKKRRIWAYLDDKIPAFDFGLTFRGKGAAPDPATDRGSLTTPKLFRRQSSWAVQEKTGIFIGNFKAYLQKNPDVCYRTTDFLANSIYAATPRLLSDFVNADSSVVVQPHEIIFAEKPSKLIGRHGKTLDQW